MLDNLTFKTRLAILIGLIILARLLVFFTLTYSFNTILELVAAQKSYQSILEALLSLRTLVLTVGLSTTILIIIIAIWIAVDLTKRLKNVITLMNKLSIGDVSFEVENRTNNEIGQIYGAIEKLASANKTLTNTLKSLSKGDFTLDVKPRSEKDTAGFALINMIQNLKQLIGEIKNQAASLTTSSETILNSVSEVTAHSEETAASITETTTSVEELKQTAHLANERAQEVVANSKETIQIVNTNEKLLEATMGEMKQISEKMYTISEGIVKLSEHGKAIGNIIDTVNDLSEQSNLLAVNAAIEAAKAGEHGKNFTVVAQEIRLLAEQSKNATVQVRSILNEIQNSTSQAVLATEQGTKAVEKGVKQSAETNQSMQALSVSVSRMIQAANQISISCQQQFIGTEQMTIAMDQISKASSKLVEHMQEIESAVNSLNSIGSNFKGMTDQYVLSKE
jgi:methyl-accepting chemotaxis protein